jgi:hypothetical protein
MIEIDWDRDGGETTFTVKNGPMASDASMEVFTYLTLSEARDLLWLLQHTDTKDLGKKLEAALTDHEAWVVQNEG